MFGFIRVVILTDKGDSNKKGNLKSYEIMTIGSGEEYRLAQRERARVFIDDESNKDIIEIEAKL